MTRADVLRAIGNRYKVIAEGQEPEAKAAESLDRLMARYPNQKNRR